jgi:hypothetical protein
MGRKWIIAVSLVLSLSIAAGGHLFASEPDGSTPESAVQLYEGLSLYITEPTLDAKQPYRYVGMLVTRYYPEGNPTSNDPEDYTYVVSDGEYTEFFIPKFGIAPVVEYENGTLRLPYNELSGDGQIFSFYEKDGTQYYKFKYVITPLYRLGDGRDIRGTPRDYYVSLLNTNILVGVYHTDAWAEKRGIDRGNPHFLAGEAFVVEVETSHQATGIELEVDPSFPLNPSWERERDGETIRWRTVLYDPAYKELEGEYTFTIRALYPGGVTSEEQVMVYVSGNVHGLSEIHLTQ